MRNAEGNGKEPVGAAEELRQVTGQLHARLDRMEKLLEGGVQGFEGRSGHAASAGALPAWRRATRGEQRWAVGIAVLVALAVQWALPAGLSFRPHWLLPLLEVVLLIGLVVANPVRIERHSRALRSASLLLAALVSLANGWSAVALVRGLVAGTEGQDAGPLLMTGAGIWITNVIAFALWYWEWDRGGPAARAAGHNEFPDFLFPQMQDSHLAPRDWEPGFLDYLYMAFTNATAFSPTDVMPLSRWAKILMLAQSAVSLLTMVLVISRAVGILK
ncbi:hypothetical protein NGB36_04335 [Streptomyces sp. RB6PN25]|uniref:DUF1345 domain-containing protein n=1 Tax=Streptomyces humicola TaxID=2953240 RepID=A0ABT1PQ95_9ACTN|nr:hypothetical protein [Streptomyces humicola]MCQ4079839.1 hypothetical protein [Streptomyces humicola]